MSPGAPAGGRALFWIATALTFAGTSASPRVARAETVRLDPHTRLVLGGSGVSLEPVESGNDNLEAFEVTLELVDPSAPVSFGTLGLPMPLKVAADDVVLVSPEDEGRYYGRPILHALPDAVRADGRVVLRFELRSWRPGVGADLVSSFGFASVGPRSTVELGTTLDLTSLEAQEIRPVGLIGILFLVVGLLHLGLYVRRRGLVHYLWYGLATLSLSAWAMSNAGLARGWLPVDVPQAQFAALTLTHVNAFFMVGFLDRFLYGDRRSRAIQVAMWLNLAFALLSLVYPAFLGDAVLRPLRSSVVGGTALLALGVVSLEAFRGNRAARLIGVGVLLSAAGISYTLIFGRPGEVGSTILGLSVLGWALVTFVLFVALAQADSFVRNLEHLEATWIATRKFVPQAFLEATGKADVTEARRGDAVQLDMTVMFSDIRGFTAASESLTAEEVFTLVNDYLGVVTPPIEAAGGFVDKFIGDAVMALFPNPAAAMKGSLDSLAALDAFNENRGAKQLPTIEVGVGLHHGQLVLGTLGSEERLSATVMGDTVNLASRVEGLTKYYGARLVVTEAVVDALPEAHPHRLRPLDRVMVKGKVQPVEVYAVLDAEHVNHAESLWAGRDAWERVLADFRAGTFEPLVPALEALLRATPRDETARLYLDRVRVLLEEPPTRWDGVWTRTSK